MKLAQVTDTHYGFSHKTHKIHLKLLRKIARLYKEGKIEALLHTGDWASINQDQLMRTWAMFRKELDDLPIWTVLGNHDHWDHTSWGLPLKKRVWKTDYVSGKPYMAFENDWEEWAGEFDITLLEPHGPIIKPEKNIAVFGFNGWYDEINPNTNDHYYMPKTVDGAPINHFLRWKADKKIEQCFLDAQEIKIKYPDIKTILLTHHPSYGFEPAYWSMQANHRYMEFIAEYFDIYCCGHSHRQEDWVYKSPDGHYLRCINAGSCNEMAKQKGHRYDAPIVKVFDTEEPLDLEKAIPWRREYVYSSLNKN